MTERAIGMSHSNELGTVWMICACIYVLTAYASAADVQMSQVTPQELAAAEAASSAQPSLPGDAYKKYEVLKPDSECNTCTVILHKIYMNEKQVPLNLCVKLLKQWPEFKDVYIQVCAFPVASCACMPNLTPCIRGIVPLCAVPSDLVLPSAKWRCNAVRTASVMLLYELGTYGFLTMNFCCWVQALVQ